MGLDPALELSPKSPALPLKRGSWLHALQEAYHREWAGVPIVLQYGRVKGNVTSWEDVHEALTQEFEALFDEEKEMYGPELPNECERLFRGYLRTHQTDRERYKVAVLQDGRPAVEFLVEQPLDRWGIRDPFKGRVDLLVEDLEYGGLWIRDAKWVKSLPKPDERMMSPQAMMYVWSLRLDKYDVRGFIFDYGRTKPPTKPNVLKRTGLLTMKHSLDSDEYTYLAAIRELHGENWKNAAGTIYIEKLRELRARAGDWYVRERTPTEPHKIRQALIEYLISIKDVERRNLKNPPRSYFYNCKFTCSFHDPCVAQFMGMDIQPLLREKFTFEEERYKADNELLDYAGSSD